MLWSSFLLALREIRRNLLRSFLTILGIVIGVSAVITMVTLGNGATQAVKNQVSSLGSNLLQIRNGQRMMGPPGGGGGGGSPPFSLEDVAAIRNQITGLAAVAPEVSKSATVVSMSNNWSTSVTGSSNDFFIAGSWKLAAGRTFSEAEEKAGQTVCLIGETIRRELFGTQQPVGESLRVNNFSCEIIGILVSKGQASMGRDQDDTVIMPIKAVQRRLTGNQNVSSIQVSVADENDITSVKEQLTNLMRERRRLGDDKDDNFNVQDTRQIAEALSGTTQVMTTLLAAVASVSLLVGGIGIMNIMLVSVTERTREIGIRLAIGALEREVLLQFLIEAVVLASLGGLVGIGLATLASIGLSQVMNVPYTFNVGINLLSFVFSAGIGVLFGYMPAKRAARLDPIDALRHE
ncbi:ABC transporter permease [Thiothrix fructosivorans]|uniref:ABC transporter permease n=1 Tax=Thiothrix fructosivorans TaxID=111770 RepID=A0A8B0SML6_9GAMM|nr:ABC transporter permease [Thiothrix fructosivorans]MBO0613626.1 ABC transporter permease [Thiothrix fructosivorans]QTX10957.1 ABC transporter permease [Thiothrix fructosivorans]